MIQVCYKDICTFVMYQLSLSFQYKKKIFELSNMKKNVIIFASSWADHDLCKKIEWEYIISIK